jgi:hypothetical protein
MPKKKIKRKITAERRKKLLLNLQKACETVEKIAPTRVQPRRGLISVKKNCTNTKCWVQTNLNKIIL